MAISAEQIMGARGADVVTIGPEATIAEVADVLERHRIGAVVVLEADGKVVGIISERDVVRHLAVEGEQCLGVTVNDAMTGSVTTCRPGATTDDLMTVMTEGRFRHVPVTDDKGGLVGIVSIGDVVKATIESLEVEKESLAEYITGGY